MKKKVSVHVNKLLLNKRYNTPQICGSLGNADVPECLVMLSPALVQAVSLAVQNISLCFNSGCDSGGLKYSKLCHWSGCECWSSEYFLLFYSLHLEIRLIGI